MGNIKIQMNIEEEKVLQLLKTLIKKRIQGKITGWEASLLEALIYYAQK
jgi:hypothetical protein